MKTKKTNLKVYNFIKSSSGALYGITEEKSRLIDSPEVIYKRIIKESNKNKKIKIINDNLIMIDGDFFVYIYDFNK